MKHRTPDRLTPSERSINMSRIRGKNTGPEMIVRSALHAEGFRYRLHARTVAGRPDVVFPKERVAVFVDGCFWHGCPSHAVSPWNNRVFWSAKLGRNVERDRETTRELRRDGWCVLRVWEHEVEKSVDSVLRRIVKAVLRRRATGRAVDGPR